MKDFLRKLARSRALWVGLIIVVQTAVYILAGQAKAYFHMDELYSYGLSNYHAVQPYEDADFYGQWHTPAYYDDYLTVNENERGDFVPVYTNQRDDVHPPLFYLLIRIGMELTPGYFTKWTGIILNIAIAAVNTILMYMIVERLLKKERGKRAKALILTLVVALSLATVSTVVYIRMYELLTMWVLLTAYLHLRLLESEKMSKKLLVGIGVTAFLGAMTQYYYLFFLAALFVFFTVKYLREKRQQEWRAYLITLVVAGGAALLVFPFIIMHLFFSNRGGGVLLALIQPLVLLDNLWKYITVINRYDFHLLFLVVILAMLFLGGYGLMRKKELRISAGQQGVFAMLLVPTLFYLLIVAAASPFTELRYIAPVCGLLLVLTIYILYKLLEMYFRPRTCDIVMGVMLIASGVVMPITGQIEPDVIYRERAEVVARVKELHEAPALYLTMGRGDWMFLNVMPLFREIDQSYIVKDLSGNEEQIERRIRETVKDQDLSRGLLVVINDEYDHSEILKAIEDALGMYDVEHVAQVVTSDIYYIRQIELPERLAKE